MSTEGSNALKGAISEPTCAEPWITSGCVAVFVDQATEDVDALDPSREGQWCHGCGGGWNRNLEVMRCAAVL